MNNETERKRRVLFVCVHNSFRSQMAEAIMKAKYSDLFEAESAGLDESGFAADGAASGGSVPGPAHRMPVNPLAVEAMKERGIDISGASVDNVFDFYREGRLYNYVIAVCSREAEHNCPIFPGTAKRLHWNLEDPESYTGTHGEKLIRAIALRNEIERRIDEFVKSV